MDHPKRAHSGKLSQQPRNDSCSRPVNLPNALQRIRQAATKDKQMQFTALWHHVYNVDHLNQSYRGIKRNAVAGVDDVTWQHYGERLDENLHDLSGRLQRGAYRAKPVKRAYVPKADGSQRPVGITTLEDKIVQRATVEVMSCIYEADFKNFSHGFRPKRGPHHALDALTVGIGRRRVNWVLDADIRGFFDAINHECLVKFVEHRIADKRVVRHIKKWLNAGVLEDGELTRAKEGTPQGGSISPLLANIYLHYVFDLWADKWRKQADRGDVIIVRFADDIVVGFQNQCAAEQFHNELIERFREFDLELHADKTRLIEFGRYAASNRKARGDGKPETFDFLGFTHICSHTRKGKFTVLRQTLRKKMQRKLQELKLELRKRMHWPIKEVGAWMRTVLLGHYHYYGVPHNSRRLSAFRYHLMRNWWWTIRRRSQRNRITWERISRLAERWLPHPRIYHAYPSERLRVTT